MGLTQGEARRLRRRWRTEAARRWRPIWLAFALGGLLGAGAWSSLSGRPGACAAKEIFGMGPKGGKADGRAARVVRADLLNLREGPGTDSRIIAVLERGTELSVLGREGEWRRVRVGELVGWVHWAYLAPQSGLCD